MHHHLTSHRKRCFSLVLVLFAVCAPVAIAQEKIRIGVSLPLTGGAAGEGADLREMLNFANAHLAHGSYELSFQDDQCSDKQAVTIAHNFVDQEKAKYVLGFACSGALLAAAPVYEKGKVVTIALAAGAPAISQAGDFIFRTIPNLEVAAVKLFQHVNHRYKKIGVVSEETAYCQGLATAFSNQNTNSEIQIVRENYLPETTDFKALLLKLQSQKVDAIFLNPQTEAGMIDLYRSVLNLQLKVPIVGVYYPSFSDFLKTYGDKADGIVFADLPFLADSLAEKDKVIYEMYKKERGVPKSSEFYFLTAMGAFDALNRAIQSQTDVRSFLYSQSFDGIAGQFKFDKNGDVVGDKLTFVLKTISKGQPILIK